MWKTIDKPKTLKVTRALVREFSEMTPAPYDRPLSGRRMQVYQRILNAGEFRPVTWASAHCQETDDVYRVNGKHTSMMLSGLEGELPEFYVTIERYECVTLNDVAQLYNTFDSSTSSRTSADMYLAFAATMPEMASVSRKAVQLVVSAASFHKWGEEYTARPAAERAELLLDNGEFALWLNNLIKTDKKYRHISRVPVTNAMYNTFARVKGDSTKFWTLVREESAPDKDCPTRVLARYLVRASIRGSKAGAKLAQPREMYVKCLHAWNAWRNSETTNLNYYPNAKIPSVI